MKAADGRCVICGRLGFTRNGTTLKYANARPLYQEHIHLYAFRMTGRRQIVALICTYCVRDLKEKASERRPLRAIERAAAASIPTGR